MNRIEKTMGEQFSKVFADFFDEAIEKAKANNDGIGLRDLEAAKDLYYLDYFASPINQCAKLAAALNEVES